MNTMVKFDEKVVGLIEFLPHGSKSIISEMAGVSKATATKFFAKKRVTFKKGEALFLATLKFYMTVRNREIVMLKEGAKEEQDEIDRIVKANAHLIK